MGLGLQSHGRDQEHWVVLHDQEEGYQPPITFRSGSIQAKIGFELF